MDLQPGATLQHYRIVDKIGEGGMGVVWRAVDTTLDREVAIKVLPTDSAADADRLARFEREAKLLASLNHPNIAAIHGLHRAGDTHFLAMELVPGEDLAERIDAGPIPLDAALKIARQLTHALEAAHSAGVVHRDLKPANIRITPGNVVKVLDFGLAKALAPAAGAGADHDPAQSPTVTSLGTVAGLVLGTAAYMAPEQARGQEVDHRADIWAFGVVLYEMLNGARLFSGNTVSDTMAAVLTREPDWETLAPQVRRLLRACLQKEPEDRLRDIGDAMLLVDDAAEITAAAAPAGTRTTARSWLLAGAALAIGAALGATALNYSHTDDPPPTLRFFEQPPAGGHFLGAPMPSPDGRHLAMIVQGVDGNRSIWVRSLEDAAAREIDGTGNAGNLRWSPDSTELLYTRNDSINRVRRDGSLNRIVVPTQLPNAVAWAPDGTLFFATNAGGLQRVSADGGEPETMQLPTEGIAFRSVEFAPSGPHVLLRQFGGSNGIYAVNTDGSNRRMVLPGVDSAVRFLPPDQIFYVENRTLLAQRVDPTTMTPVGEAQLVASDVGQADFETSVSGMISFVPGAAQLSVLTNFDRSGTVTGTSGEPAEYQELLLSPDGTQLLYVIADPSTGNLDLWLQDLQGSAPSRFSTSPDTDHLAAFSPTGSEIVWEAHSAGDLVLMRRPTDMSAPAEMLLEWNRGGGPADWSPDGTFILYGSDDGPTRQNLWAVPLDGGEPQAVIDAAFAERDGRFSPGGDWLAYTSDETGRDEIYLQRLNGMERVLGPHRISANGGVNAQWRADGRELFFLQGTTLMAVDIDLTADRHQNTPRALFDIGVRPRYPGYVVALDGQSFTAIVQATDAPASAATVIVNWGAGR